VNISFTCKNIQTSAGYRPGELGIKAEGVALDGLQDDKALLGYMDIKNVFEWLAEQGFQVTEKEMAA